MSTQNITKNGANGGVTVRDIRSAPGFSAHAARIEAEGATLTATSAGRGVTPWVASDAVFGVAPTRPASVGERLMERKLVQWTVWYVAVASWILQVASVLSQSWSLSAPFQQAVSLTLGMGVLPAVVIAWYHGEKGRQRVCTTECALVAASVLASVIVVWSLCRGKAL